jgi:hypothetical protein
MFPFQMGTTVISCSIFVVTVWTTVKDAFIYWWYPPCQMFITVILMKPLCWPCWMNHCGENEHLLMFPFHTFTTVTINITYMRPLWCHCLHHCAECSHLLMSPVRGEHHLWSLRSIFVVTVYTTVLNINIYWCSPFRCLPLWQWMWSLCRSLVAFFLMIDA